MHKTVKILKDIELMLLQAELRIATLNGELSSALVENSSDIGDFLMGLETIHNQTTRLENALLKKMIYTLKARNTPKEEDVK